MPDQQATTRIAALHGWRTPSAEQKTQLAAGDVLPYLTVTASVVLAVVFLVGAPAESPSHPLFAAQIGLAFAQLAILSTLAFLTRGVSPLRIAGLAIAGMVWTACLGVGGIEFWAWAPPVFGVIAVVACSSLILKQLGGELSAKSRGVNLRTASMQHPFDLSQQSAASRWQFSLANVMAVTTILAIIAQVARAAISGEITAEMLTTAGRIVEVLAPLPFLTLALAVLILGRDAKLRVYLFGASAVVIALALIPVAIADQGDSTLWLKQIYGCNSLFVICYLLIIRQCGGRISWRNADVAPAQ